MQVDRNEQVGKLLSIIPQDRELEDIVFLASVICDTPVSVITLLDEQRQYFAVKKGIELEGSPVGHAFCNYTIKQEDVMIVPDALEDPRFSTNPLVKGAPNIRFYAGASLKTSAGTSLGSLCAIAPYPKQLSDEQANSMKILSKLVVLRFESLMKDVTIEDHKRKEAKHLELLAEANRSLDRAAKEIAELANRSVELLWVIDFDFKTVMFNRGLAELAKKAWGITISNNKTLEETGVPGKIIEKLRTIVKQLTPAQSYIENFSYRIENTTHHFEVMYSIEDSDQSQKIQIIAKDKSQLNDNYTLLKDIAWMQSHSLRRHIANILGVMDILNEQLAGEGELTELYRYLKNEGETLDSLLKEGADKLYKKLQEKLSYS